MRLNAWNRPLDGSVGTLMKKRLESPSVFETVVEPDEKFTMLCMCWR